MTVEQARNALEKAIAEDDQRLTNFVARGESLAPASVSKFDLVEQMAATVSQDLVRIVSALAQKQFLSYDPSYQTNSSQVLVEQLVEIPALEELDSQVRSDSAPFDGGGDPVVAMVHAIGTGANKIVGYRVRGPGIATKRAKGFTLFPRDGVYRPIDDEVLYYEPRFDVFTCAGYAYFVTVSLIQTKLHADGKARSLAHETLKKATANVAIDGFAELAVAVMDDPTLRAKMAYVARLLESDPDYSRNLTTKNLVRFVEENPDYDIALSLVGRKKSLRFDPSPQRRHQIPRLLADDYLLSVLTNRKYEAGSKHQV